MTSVGWIKLWRRALEHPYLQEYDTLGLFTKMLMLAQHQDADVYCENAKCVLKLGRGQLWISQRGFSTESTSRKRIRTILRNLEEGGLISTKWGPARGPLKGPGITVVTICNYNKYQDAPETGAQDGAQGGAREGPTEQEVKEDKKDSPLIAPPQGEPKKTKRSRSDRGTRLPPDWQPSERNLQDAENIGLNAADAFREAERFGDYWAGCPGQRGLKRDWDATWRNWCRRAVDQRKLTRNNAHGSNKETAIETAVKVLGRARRSAAHAGADSVVAEDQAHPGPGGEQGGDILDMVPGPVTLADPPSGSGVESPRIDRGVVARLVRS